MIEEIRRLAGEGLSHAEIAAVLGMPRGSVATLCHKHRIVTGGKRPGREAFARAEHPGWSLDPEQQRGWFAQMDARFRVAAAEAGQGPRQAFAARPLAGRAPEQANAPGGEKNG